MLEANTFPKDGAARGREYRNSQYTYRDRWTKVTARVLWNGLREQGSVLGYQNIRPNNGAKYVARWNLWYERKELSLPSSLLFLLPLSPSNAVEQNFSVFLSFSLSPPPLSRAKSRIFTRHDRNFFVVDEYKFLFLPLPSPSIETRKISMSLLCAVPLPSESIGRSTGTIFGIIHSVAWNYICKNVNGIAGGRMILSRERFLYSSSRRRGRGEDIRTKTKFWGVYLTCFREYVMNRSVVDSSIIVEIFFFFFRWY